MNPEQLQEFKAPARFKIHRRLGAGGFGVVYEAYDRERETVVALKELTRTDPAALYRFKREFRTLADLAHPNLVTLYELISSEEQWLLAMELVRGVSFLDYVLDVRSGEPGFTSTPSESESAPTVASSSAPDLAGRGSRPRPAPFQPDRLRSSLRQLVDGVRHLHQHSILHRDIKPSNVLVTKEGRVVLLDFGLAQEVAADQTADDNRIVGTPEYMSPEQAAGAALSEASDWYSVGVVLYVSMTGRPPFSGTFRTMLEDKQIRDATPPHELVSGLPADLDSLCADLLQRDPAKRPAGSDVVDRLAGQPAKRTRPRVTSRRKARLFVGREPQLAALGRAFAVVRGGKPVTVYVRGSSGMGKSALIRHFLEGLSDRGDEAVVLAGRCYEQEAVPYKALDSVVDALADYLRGLPRAQAESLLPRGVWALARVFPVLQRVDAIQSASHRSPDIRDSHELRRRASAALRDMLGRIAERRPLVVFIDDLQWGDVDSASILTDLLRPPDPPALLLVACYRGEEAAGNAVLQTLLSLQPEHAANDVTLEVGQLSPAEAGELARSLVGDDRELLARAGTIARESGGHPFFIDQLVRYGQAEASDTSLDAVLLARAAELPPASRMLLELAAVAGRPIDIAVANTAADLASGDYDVVSALRAGQFIRTRVAARREIEPYHDRVRETIVASLTPETRARHHRRLAVALEDSGRADPEALFVHFRGAGESAKAAYYARAAADQAAGALAFERAARLYRLALPLVEWEPQERHRILVKLGDALANNGRVIEAAETYLNAAEDAGPKERRELERQAGEQFLMGGYLDEGMERLRAVLAAAGLPLPSSPRRALAWILLRRPYMLLRGTRFRERDERELSPDDLWRIDLCHSTVRSLGFTQTMYAIEFQMRHLLLALEVGEPYRVTRALGFEAIADARDTSSRPRAHRLLQQVRDLMDRVPAHHRPDAQANLHVTAGMLAFQAGEWKTAASELPQAEHMFREQSALPYKLVVVQVYTLSALWYSGRLAEYFRWIPEYLKESLDRGNAFAEASLRLHNAQRRLLADDDPDGAEEELREARARWSPRGFLQIHATELFHQVDFALYRGEPALAWDTIARGMADLDRSMLLRLQTVRVLAWFVRARAALAMADDAVAERDAASLARERIAWATPMAHLVRACIAARRGDTAACAARFADAATGFDAAGMAMHAAVARMRRGALSGGDEGRQVALAASRWMTDQGVKNPLRVLALFAPGVQAP